MRRRLKGALHKGLGNLSEWLGRRYVEAPPRQIVPGAEAWAGESEAFQSVLRANMDRNGSELHLLLPLRWLRAAAALAGSDFRGQLLEVGSYGHPGFALALLLLGAEVVHLDNVVPVENVLPRAHAETLYALMSGFGLPLRRRLEEVVEPLSDTEVRIDPARIRIHSETDASALDLPAGSIRGVFSMAVLEHVPDPGAIFDKTHALLERGGWFFHAVDMRDHRDYSQPLEFLKLTEGAFAASGSDQNRWRGPDFERAATEVGFEVLEATYATPFATNEAGTTDVFSMLLRSQDELFQPLPETTPWVSEALRASLQPEFQRFSLQELSATGINLTGKKP